MRLRISPSSQTGHKVSWSSVLRHPALVVLLTVAGVKRVTAFVPSSMHNRVLVQRPCLVLQSTAESTEAVQEAVKSPSTKTLGLLTFDLDDTLYPIDPVIDEANAAFARAMNKYGFPDIEPEDINKESIQLRKEMAKTDPEGAAVLSHTEIRRMAIRKEMEDVMLERKLIECAKDWATNVESLGPAVVKSART